MSAIEILIMILTLFALCALIKSNRSTPVFVIQLILSDLIQIICKLTETITGSAEVEDAYDYSLIVGLYFMACVAFERYLLVSHPIWYRSHHSLKVCCVVSVIIWFVPLIFADFTDSIGCLIPYPIVILCFVGTCRGLSRTISLTSLKRKRILGSLFLVLLTYTFLILPFVIVTFTEDQIYRYSYKLFYIFRYCSEYLMFLNPLADCVLYMFLRPDVGGLMKSVHCCCRTDVGGLMKSVHCCCRTDVGGLMKSVHCCCRTDVGGLMKSVHCCCRTDVGGLMKSVHCCCRTDVGGLMKSVHCCCRTDTHQSSTHSRDEHSRDSSAAFACCVSMQKPASHSQTACSSV
ncbi:hypothetical protein PO909_013423 [Leuciscus waleckii]